MRTLATLPLAVVLLLPLLASLLFIMPGVADLDSFRALAEHPQFWGALALSLATGLTSTAVSLVLALVMIFAARGKNLSSRAGLFLAVPHVSFAIGLAFLIMPAGLLARAVALAAGWTMPPQWVTTQDPWGLALTVALVLKETPFLVWTFASLLAREDLAAGFAGQRAVARSLGHGEASTFLRVIVPQLLPQALGPLIAVLAYGMTVVDMALVIGPTQPPTLAQLAWTGLSDAESATAARGAAGVLVLCAVVAAILAAASVVLKCSRPHLHRFYAASPRPGEGLGGAAQLLWPALLAVYVAVAAVMLLQSAAAQWPFPDLLPNVSTLRAWTHLLSDPRPVMTSVVLALSTTACATAATVIWLEWAPRAMDRVMTMCALTAVTVPMLLIALGEYRAFLALDLTGTAVALWTAHAVPVCAYVFLLLARPYRAYGTQWAAVAAGLQQGRARFLWRVKWPMLKGPMWAAAAVGFAVSVGQYVPAQLAAAGRFSTLPMEAVTLSSGGNRPLLAVYGIALMALPLGAFLFAARAGRSRWSTP